MVLDKSTFRNVFGDIGDSSLQLQFNGVMMLYKEYAEHH